MRRINQQDGVSMLLVEQNATLALDLATEAYVFETGQVVVSGAGRGYSEGRIGATVLSWVLTAA